MLTQYGNGDDCSAGVVGAAMLLCDDVLWEVEMYRRAHKFCSVGEDNDIELGLCESNMAWKK